MGGGLKRFIFWEFPRASWQYDVVVVLILGFIFLTPRELFRDQPKPRTMVMLSSEKGANVFWIAPDWMTGLPEQDRAAKAADLLKDRNGRKHELIRLETIFDDEKDIKGFMAYTKP